MYSEKGNKVIFMKKFFGLLVLLLMITSNCFAITFSQLVEVGNVTFPPAKGVLIRGASYSTLTKIGDWQGENLYTAEGLARWGNESNGLYYFFEKYPPRFGGKDRNFSVNSMVMTSINQIKNDGNITLYLLRNDGHATFARNYVLLGKRQDGTWVKYFDSDDLKKKYCGTTNRTIFDNAYCRGDTIIIKYNNDRNSHVGEFRFKWDDKAQWFSVEHIVY